MKSVATVLQCLQHFATSVSRVDDPSCTNNTNSLAGLTQGTIHDRGTGTTSPMQHVTVFVSPSSLTFYAFDEANQTQASVGIEAGLFCEYQVNQQAMGTNDDNNNNNHSVVNDWQSVGEFGLNLSAVLDFLQLYRAAGNMENTSISLSYNLA